MARAFVFDTIVIGGGIFGLSTAVELAQRGDRVALIDRWGSGHAVTSSTGASRSIRVAYDHPFYVALDEEAITAWDKLARDSGRHILHLTGQIDLGPAAKLTSLQQHVRAAGMAIDFLDRAELARRFPEMRLQPHEGALFHVQAGTVMAEAGMLALAEAAIRAGVSIFAPEPATDITLEGDGVRVTTPARALAAGRAVLSAGPWSGALLQKIGIALPLAPAVAQVTFLDAPQLVERPGIAEWAAIGEDGAGGGLYGHPVPGIGYKIAFDAGAEGWDGDVDSWTPDMAEERRLLAWFATRFPGTPSKVARTQRHPWTMTPDADFIVDQAGGEWGSRLVLACGCSGHAFKFGPALGRLVADVAEGKPAELLRRDRPGLKASVTATSPIIR
jgi:sarcosine oxidase